MEPYSENSSLLQPLLCGHLSAAPQPSSHLTLMFCFILWLVWSRKTQTPHAQVSRGGSHHSKERARPWRPQLHINCSESISSAPLETVPDPVSPWPESCAEERHQHGGFLLQPRSLFFSLCLPSLPRCCLFLGSCFGTRHWNFH